MREAVKTFLKTIYLLPLRLIGQRKFSRKQQIVFFLSFPSTSHYLLTELYEKYGERLVICYQRDGRALAEFYGKRGCSIYSLDNYFELMTKVISCAKSSSIVLCDNYFPILGAIAFMDDQKVVQLWHSDGAVKEFGLEAKYVKQVYEADRQRYRSVYQKFTHYVVASDMMVQIFTRSYDANDAEFLNFGYTPADDYFSEEWRDKTLQKINDRFGRQKKLLYLPTYREDNSVATIDFEEISRLLGDEWQLFAKAHPHAIQWQKFLQKEKVVTDFKGLTVQELMVGVDYLVTDYSSVAFEFPMANPSGKLFFYCYDLKEYQNTVGIQDVFLKFLENNAAKDMEELLVQFQNNRNRIDYTDFNQTWNQYNDGTAKQQLMNWIEENI